MAPSEFRQFFEESLPEAMEGARFLERFGRHWDGATQVQAGTSYPVAQATSHPINENFRVQCFRQALLQPQGDTPQLLGELMYQVRHVPPDASHSKVPLCSWALNPGPLLHSELPCAWKRLSRAQAWLLCELLACHCHTVSVRLTPYFRHAICYQRRWDRVGYVCVNVYRDSCQCRATPRTAAVGWAPKPRTGWWR